MSLYTSNYLKSVFNTYGRNINESIRTRAFSSSENTKFDIFLSHSLLDKEEVLGLYYDLTNKGYKVYVDWIVDPHLDRLNVTKQSAALIRTRMKNSKSLLLAVSYNASVSKWMPWELGYVDGCTSKCAISPISTDNVQRSTYKGVEYLSLYPYIERRGILGMEQLYINDDVNQVSFTQWLNANVSSSSVRTL